MKYINLSSLVRNASENTDIFSLALKKAIAVDVSIVNTSGSINNFSTSEESSFKFTAATEITGFSGGTDGKLITIHNANANSLIIANNSSSSSSGNKNFTGTGSNLTLLTNSSILLQYDIDSTIWRIIGGSGGGGTSSANEEIISINSGSSININSNGSIFTTYEDGHYDFMSTSDPTLSFELFIKNGSPPDATIITSSNLVFDSDESGYLCSFISGNNLVLKNNLSYSVSLKVFFVGVS